MADSPDHEPRPRAFTALPKPDSREERDEIRRERRGLFELPQGAFGFFLLLVLAALSGGLIALYWPWLQGGDTASQTERISALETRIDQMATGQAPKAAAGAFADVQRDMKSLAARLDADEARLTAVERNGGQSGDGDAAGLKSSLDETSASVAALVARVAKLEQGEGSVQIRSRLDASEKAIGELRTNGDAQAKSSGDAVASLGTRVTALERTAPPPDLAARLDSFALKTASDALNVRLTHLEANDSVGMIRRASAVLALANLVRATAGASPYAPELSTLHSFVPNMPELDDLSRYARTGVPTRTMLAAQFPAVAASALSAERSGRASNWMSRLWANVASSVSIRRVGDVSGNDTESRLARAGSRLDAGDLPGALSEMQALDMPARKAAANWIADAAARIAVDRATRALANRLVQALPQQAAPG